MSGDDRIAAEVGLKFEKIEIATDQVDADIASFALDLSVPPTPIAKWSQLSGFSLFEWVDFAAGLDLRMELVGDRLSLPGEVVLEWFDLNLVQGPAGRRNSVDTISRQLFPQPICEWGGSRCNRSRLFGM